MALIAIGIAAALSASPVLRPFENWSLDTRLSLRGERTPDPDVVVVAINQPSLDALGERWPIGRRHYADLIDRLSGAGARVIAFTAEFDAPTSPENDTPMIEAMRRAGNVVLAASAADSNGETDILGNAAARRYARVGIGMANLPGDDDKTIRHLEWSIQGVPTLALEVSRRLGRSPDRSAFRDGRAWLDIRGRPCAPDQPSSCAIPTYGFTDALGMSGSRARDAFAGKVVVVGPTASGAGHTVAAWGPGPDVTTAPHLVALQVATVLNDFPLRQASWLLGALFLVVAGLLPMTLDGLGRWALGARRKAGNALNGWFGALSTAGFGVLAIVIIGGIAVLAFDRGTVIPVGAPLLAAFLAGSFGVINRYLADTLNAQRLYTAAHSVVPKEFVGELLARCEDPERRTAKVEKGTVMFVDVAGFTEITTALMEQPGKTDNERTMDVLDFASEFQDLVVGKVFRNDGVVVDIMGDGVMAAFGLVGRSKEHVDLALKTAHMACTDVVESMRQWLKQQSWDLAGVSDFDVRVGLDSGEVAVGLTGHEGGLEFSVIALPTIRAFRLQEVAKGLGVTLCASVKTFSEGVGVEARELIPAELRDVPVELRKKGGVPPSVYAWTRDDARDGLAPLQVGHS
ncbi:MAG TPA: adenylate/guanylate cyclase domain-containing protein [Solirubrobacterales bacterium]|nr:adenylate/guanylate cyclase domain-containing protein [Solirubrobacterales bacterium]